MDFLPKELWFEIFEYLNETDLHALTLCCREFNSIITETKLVDKFTLHLNNYSLDEWHTMKKYCQMQIKECNDLEKCISIAAAVGVNLVKISVIKMQMKLSKLVQLLKYCPNLKQFRFNNLKINEDSDSQMLESIYENVKIIFEDSSPVIFKIFMKSSAIEVYVDNKCSNEHVNFNPLRDFLKIQENMISLSLSYFSINTNLFADNVLDFVPFKLKNFSTNNVYLNTESVARFHTFLMNHTTTLEFLFLQSPFIDVSFFNQFSVLKELHLCHTNAFFDSFENIKKLTAENVSGNFMIKFPNLKKLTLIYKYGVFLGMYADLVKLSQLEALSIIDSKIPELDIPSVKKLSLTNTTICHKRPFKYEDSQIKELELTRCSSIEWIADYLSQETTRLNVLIIRNMNINALIHKIINTCVGRKIKLLKIFNS